MTRRDVRLLGFFLILPALFFLFPFLRGECHFAGDILYSFQPWLTYAAQRLQAGSFPLWNPYTACGEPFLANPQTKLFFPAAMLFWMFPFPGAWGIFLFLSQSLLFLSAYLLARTGSPGPAGTAGPGGALLAALAVTWGGFVVVYWEFPSAVGALPFVVFTFLFTVRRLWVPLALSIAMMIFSGYVQFAYYAVLLSGMGLLAGGPRRPFSPWLRALAGWGGAAAFAGLLALAQILTSWEAVTNSLRTAISDAEAKSHLLTPVFFVKFLIPDIFNKVALPFSSPAFGGDLWPVHWNWLNTFYIGTAPFLLGMAGLVHLRRRPVAFWAAVLVLSAAAALGTEPLLSVLRGVIPGMRYMTHFSNIMLLAVLALAFLSAHGLERDLRTVRAVWVLWALVTAGATALAFSGTLRQALLAGLLGLEKLSPAQDAHALGAVWKSLAGLAVFGLATASPRAVRLPLLLLLTFTELWLFGRDLHPAVNADFFRRPVPLARSLAASPFRLTFNPELIRAPRLLEGNSLAEGYQSVRQKLYPNQHLPFQVPSTWGYEVFPIKRFGEFRRSIPLEKPFGPAIRFLAGAFVISGTPLAPPMKPLAQTASVYLYNDPAALPRASWVAGARILPDPEGRLGYLSTDWDPSEEVVLEEDAPPFEPAPPRLKRKAFHWSEAPGRLEAAGDTGAGWLVYSQVNYPGWRAYLNGRRTAVRRANHAFMAVETPEGPWEAVLLHRPALFRLGLGAALAGLSALGAVFFVRLRAPRREA